WSVLLPQELTSHSQGPCKQAMVTCIPEYAPYLCIASLSTTLLVRAISSLNNLPIATTMLKTWGGEESDGSAGGGVKRGRKLFLQGRGEHRFITVVIRIVRSISIVIIALLPYVTIK
ncbi:uncharacterized protein K444DRAFT_619171, partial [Hyaloscypha bicolor E]